MHKLFLYSLIALVVGGAGLTIIQMWAPIMDWGMYMKAMITIGILALLVGFLIIIKADLGQHKRLKDENYLD